MATQPVISSTPSSAADVEAKPRRVGGVKRVAPKNARQPRRRGGPGRGDSLGAAARKKQRAPLERPLAIRAIEGVYVILIGVLVALIGYTILTPLGAPDIVPSAPQGTKAGPTDIGIFGRYDPFIGGQAPMPMEMAAADTEETSLNLSLSGIFYDADFSTATIKVNNAPAAIFREGDELMPGVVIEEIRPDQVLLRRAGVRETLSLEGRERREPQTSRSSGPPNTAQSPAAIPTAGPISGASALAARYVQLSPHPSGQGFLIAAGDEPAMFRAAGLQDGDHLVAINEQSVSSNQTAIIAMIARQVAAGNPVELTVRRNDRALTLELDPAELQ